MKERLEELRNYKLELYGKAEKKSLELQQIKLNFDKIQNELSQINNQINEINIRINELEKNNENNN